MTDSEQVAEYIITLLQTMSRASQGFTYGVGKSVINFTEGKIEVNEGNIFVVSDYEYLNALSEKGSVEKRDDPGGTEAYFYAEAVADKMRFGAYISLRDRKIEWIRLSWLDSSMKGWDDVSEKGVKDEFRLLLNLTENMIGRPPDSKKSRLRSWHLEWGQLNVSYDLRAFQADIYMKPRRWSRQAGRHLV